MKLLSDVLLKLVLMALAFCATAFLLRDGMTVGLHVPLDPNEGWNAYHALAAMNGTPLYPHSLMINNYPPLSFYLVGLLGRSVGDYIVAGRVVSLLSFLAVAMGLAVLLRQIGARVLDGIFAGLFFAAALLIASDYVGMNDPQLLGHALEIEALLLLLREKPATPFVALLLVAGLFVKHNLIVLPLAAFVWLLAHNWREALRLAAYGIGFAALGLIATWLLLGVNLPAELVSARVWRLANATTAMTHYLTWAGLPLLLTAGLGWRFRRDPWMQFCLIYAGIALALGAIFSAGDGVDANIFFDLDIALALVAGLALKHAPAAWRGAIALAFVAPLTLFLALNFTDDNFTYSEGFQKQAPVDIGFMGGGGDGPVLCENLTLCYWAGVDATVDVFNVSEQLKTGARSDAELIALFQRRFFRTIEFDTMTPFALGPKVQAALNAQYRVDHVDDNGVFLVPR